MPAGRLHWQMGSLCTWGQHQVWLSTCSGVLFVIFTVSNWYVRQQAHASWAAALADGLSLHLEAATGLYDEICMRYRMVLFLYHCCCHCYCCVQGCCFPVGPQETAAAAAAARPCPFSSARFYITCCSHRCCCHCCYCHCCCCCCCAGLLLPCWAPNSSSSNKASSLPERFYLGGVESNLRGFDIRGIGPSEPRRIAAAAASRSSSAGGAGSSSSGSSSAEVGPEAILRDSLGGDVFGSIYAALMIRLPGKAGDLGVHAHVFANGGSSVLLQQQGGSSSSSSGGAAAAAAGGLGGLLGGIGEKLRSSGKELGSTFRWSTGGRQL
jgi:hypothetical protein